MIENEKRENMEIKEILQKSSSKRSFTNGIHSLLKRTDARKSADIIYIICDTYRYSVRVRHSYWHPKVAHAQNI